MVYNVLNNDGIGKILLHQKSIGGYSMLVLSRRPGESIMIGEKIKVKIMESSDGAVRIGIDAPHDISVHREEVYFVIKNGTASDKIGNRTISDGSLHDVGEVKEELAPGNKK